MQKRHRIKAFFAAATTGALLAAIGAQAWADEAAKAKPLALRTIMQDLGKNMQAATDGISREDWEVVAKAAAAIADHPRPPLGEKMRILGFVGSDAGRFKAYDEKTHQAARGLAQAANQKDGQAVIAAFATLQTGCLTCHQTFRRPFVEHFYGQR